VIAGGVREAASGDLLPGTYVQVPRVSTQEVCMGIFDKMFGRGASEVADKPQAQQRFATLKHKYQPVLQTIEHEGVQLRNLHVQDEKLFIRGTAPSEAAKNKVWDEIKRIDAGLSDITADISVQPQAQPAAAKAQQKTYTVKAGDTLSKISREFYGDGHEYMRIFYANRDKLRDPDLIKVGQELVIPPDDGR
jgi:nucleoid-associated protein YgaU